MVYKLLLSNNLGYSLKASTKALKEAPQTIIELEHMGLPFSRTDEGKIYQRNWELVAQGTRMTKEFAAFLKVIHRYQTGM